MNEARRFLDASIIINWMKTEPKHALADPIALTSGYILKRIEEGEPVVTTLTIKDELCIWLSRYNAASLQGFIETLKGYTSLEITNPTLEDEEGAAHVMGRPRLGYTDLVTLSVMRRMHLEEIYSSDTGFDHIPGVTRLFAELQKEQGYAEFKRNLQQNVG